MAQSAAPQHALLTRQRTLNVSNWSAALVHSKQSGERAAPSALSGRCSGSGARHAWLNCQRERICARTESVLHNGYSTRALTKFIVRDGGQRSEPLAYGGDRFEAERVPRILEARHVSPHLRIH